MALFSKKKFVLLLVLLLVLLNMASIGMFWFAQSPNWNKAYGVRKKGGHVIGKDHRPNVRDFLISELAFTDAQISEFDKARQTFFVEMRSVNIKLADRREELYLLLAQHPVDSTRIKEDARKMGELEEYLALLTFYHFMDVRSFCTSAQQEKFDQLIDQLITRLFPFQNRQRLRINEGRDLPEGP
jgi:Spy/CpxP family protein refolding chaperone